MNLATALDKDFVQVPLISKPETVLMKVLHEALTEFYAPAPADRVGAGRGWLMISAVKR
jgi:hypothetical protein